MIYRTLIVDDDEIIADSMYGFLNGIKELELNLHRAYSPVEALNMIKKTRFDILITDICMPGLDGFELIANLRLLWPDCRIIVLTGYKDFNFAYNALQMEGVRYILKNEGYDRILSEVKKAVSELEALNMKQEKSVQIGIRMKEMLSIIQQTYLHLILTNGYGNVELAEYVDENLNVSVGASVLLLISRIDDSDKITTLAERNSCYSTIDIVLYEYIKDYANSSMYMASNELIWLLQCPASGGNLQTLGVELAQFVWEMLPVIQEQCQLQTGLTLSFALAENECDWGILHVKRQVLSSLLDYSVGRNKGILIRENRLMLHAYEDVDQARRLSVVDLQYLENCIKINDQKGFFKTMYNLTDWMKSSIDLINPSAVSTYCAFVMLLMPYVQHLSSLNEIFIPYPARLLNISNFKSWSEALTTLNDLAEKIFEYLEQSRSNDSSYLIKTVLSYIQDHISSDLSLTQLADIVHISPSYLSRLFKEVNGVGLQDYITELRIARAKELLDKTTLRVHEIAEKSGFLSPKYFNFVFKQKVGMTPNEWRNKKGV